MDSNAAPDPAAATDSAAGNDPDRYAGAFELPLDARSVHQARRTVADLLAQWRVDDGDTPDDVLLVTSELVTNAVRHGADRITLRLIRDDRGLTVAVEDGNAVLPEPPVRAAAADGSDNEGGRGMIIVAAVAVDWGIDKLPDGGKRVWALLGL